MSGSPTEDSDRTVGYRRRSRFGRRVVFLTLLILVVVFFAPIVISRTALRHKVVPALFPDLAGTVNIGQAHLSWLSPARLDDVSIVSDEGQLLIEAKTVTSAKTLGQMAIGYHNLGTFNVQEPNAHLVLHASGTNFDALLASLADEDDDSESDSDSDHVEFGIEIVSGTINIRDNPTGDACQLNNVAMQLQSPRPSAGPLALQLVADARHQDQQGTINVDFAWNQPAVLTPHNLGSGNLQLETHELPMAALLPIYRRGNLDLSTNGGLTGNLNCEWNHGTNGPELSAEGVLSVANAVVRMPSTIGQDVLQSPVLTLAVDGAIQNEQLQIRKLDSESNYGQIQIRGDIPLAELFAKNFTEQVATWQSQHRLHTEGRFDLRKLAESLPQTMRLRADTSLVGGTVTLSLDSESTGPESRKIHGGFTTADIVAQSGDKTVSWTQPLDVKVTVDSQPLGITVERFDCSSDFFQASASGTMAAGSFEAAGDLDKLAAQLAQFCEIGASQLAGQLRSDGSWSTAADQSYEASANVTVEDFRLAYDNLPAWEEKQLVVAASAVGKASGAAVSRIDAMRATIESDQDFFSAELTAPVSGISAATAWPVDCKVRGQLTTWLARLRPWLSMGEWQISGSVVGTATGSVSTRAVSLQPCAIELTDLKAASRSHLVAEPTIRANGALQWDAATGIVALPNMEVVSSALAVRAQDVRVSMADDQLQATGAAAYRGDLTRLSSWMQNPTQPASNNLRGRLEGTVTVATQDGVVKFQGTSNCADFALFSRKTINTASLGPQATWAEVWNEAHLQLAAKGEFRNADSTLQFEQVAISGDAAQVRARGAIRQVPKNPIADLAGEIDYDLLGMMAKLRNWVGPSLQLRGRQRQPFLIRGPLTLASLQLAKRGAPDATQTAMALSLPSNGRPIVHPELAAETTFGWESASGYGVTFGPQQLSLLLQNSALSTSPLETSVSGGTISVAPRIELGSQTPTLVLDQNTKANSVQITPQMCNDWIKYVAPLLAGTATADGELSMGVSTARIPLSAPSMGEASGIVVIERARVQPGPMAQQLLSAFREASTLAKAKTPSLAFLEAGNNWLEIQQQQVEFQMTQGRIYHRNLTMSLGNVTVQTSGWVGTDQTMSVVAQVPVNDDWIADEPLLAGLRGQTIQIPIHGTLNRPQLDRRAFAKLTQQIIGTTAERYLHGELEKGLKKLLGPN